MKTEPEQKATTGPWVFCELDYVRRIIITKNISDMFAEPIAFIETKDGDTPESMFRQEREKARANAALIVKAVNAYDRDQEIIRELAGLLREVVSLPVGPIVAGDVTYPGVSIGARSPLFLEIQDAVAKAEARHA